MWSLWRLSMYLTLTIIALGTTTPTPTPLPTAATTTSRPPLTQATLLWMGNLAHFADVWASRLEAEVPSMIESDITAAIYPLQ